RSRVDVPRPHRQFRQRVTQQAMNLAWIPDFLHRCVEFLLPLLFLRRCFLADFGSPAGLGVIRGDKLHDLARSRRRVARYGYALPVGQYNFVELHRHLWLGVKSASSAASVLLPAGTLPIADI